MTSLKDLEFKSRFGKLPEDFYTRLEPTPFENPKLVAVSKQAMALIGIAEVEPGFINYFSGRQKFKNADYLASVYSGHQFGTYVPQLGDGRAMLIGEVNGWEVQLKGSGKTPYSRFGDGRAVLRSSIREFLCSEAMHNLGIPTTRALCIVGSDEPVQRETIESAAMVTRLSPSFIRFGHFEYFYYTNQHELLRELADFTIQNYFPGASYEDFFEKVVTTTAELIAKWQAVGFSHGVMNTDNMSILGLTIDYGPFGFMDAYNPGFICNHSDHTGRYAFDQQPNIGFWNLIALAQALSPLIEYEKAAKILEKYQPALIAEYSSLMRAKLGFEGKQESDLPILRELLDMMEASAVDYTIFFRNLREGKNLRDMFLDRDAFDKWHARYKARAGDGKAMDRVNPKFIIRNYLAETAIKQAESGDYKEISKLLDLLEKPFEEQPGREAYAKAPPEWALGIEVSCSS